MYGFYAFGIIGLLLVIIALLVFIFCLLSRLIDLILLNKKDNDTRTAERSEHDCRQDCGG